MDKITQILNGETVTLTNAEKHDGFLLVLNVSDDEFDSLCEEIL